MKTQYSKTRFETKGWAREEHFHFFRSFSQPFFNVHTEIDMTSLYHYARWEGLSVSLAYLHAATEAIRNTDSFLLRLEGDEVVKYEAVDMSTTILKANKTVSFVHLPHHPDLQTFCRQSLAIIEEVKESDALFSGYNGPDLIHATRLPWFKFNGLEHACTGDSSDSIPKLAFGKLEFRDKRVILPLSIQVHHALMDGYHIHLFLENLQGSINTYGVSRKFPAAVKVPKQVKPMALVQRFVSLLMNGSQSSGSMKKVG
ncbi:CatA-like O-acetyltransferase [Pontibacter korlensis]|uniref:CatA-like O-acetyltransferase n=1 Tax=Pontibacter korlensis TaxID=400092 RepID=UPI0008FF9939|nr:CatA-like O-acetyltransferase [Pontibacter korlensis]